MLPQSDLSTWEQCHFVQCSQRTRFPNHFHLCPDKQTTLAGALMAGKWSFLKTERWLSGDKVHGCTRSWQLFTRSSVDKMLCSAICLGLIFTHQWFSNCILSELLPTSVFNRFSSPTMGCRFLGCFGTHFYQSTKTASPICGEQLSCYINREGHPKVDRCSTAAGWRQGKW